MHIVCDFAHRPGIWCLFFRSALIDCDSQTSRPPSEEKQLLQQLGESRSDATRAQRESDMTHAQSQRSETHTHDNPAWLVAVSN